MKSKHSAGNEVDRREFLKLALMSSAMVMSSSELAKAAVDPTDAPAHAVLHTLSPGAVQPEGWLRKHLERQSELCSKLPQISWPFSESYWAGMEDADAWWPWEQVGYWIDGATRLAVVLQDRALMDQVRASIDYTLSHVAPDGFLGPQFLEFSEDGADAGFLRWPHNVMFRSLMALQDTNPIPGGPDKNNIAEAMRMHYLNDKASYSSGGRNITNIEAILWCYGHTGDSRLLDLAESAWRTFIQSADYAEIHGSAGSGPGRRYADCSQARVFGDTPIDCHGVTYAETMKLPAILYLHTGKSEYLQFARAAEQRIFDHHMLIDGIPSTSEVYRSRTSIDQHETCDIADHTWSWGYMLMATGDGIWADRIERACFNAAPGAIRGDWKALQYLSSPNQFIATLDSDHGPMRHGGRLMAYQPNPGQYTACCGGNVHRIFPNYVIRMWMKTRDEGLAAVLYGPSRISAKVGPRGDLVEIVQTTRYPFEENIEFKIESSQPVAFPLHLRVPAWCDDPQLTLNGAPVSVPQREDGFFVLHRTFHPGDVLMLKLPMRVAVSHWPENGIGIERGPLVYSMPIKATWSPVVEPQYTTVEFPSWEATPAAAWNYGVALNPTEIASKAEVKTEMPARDEADDPWTNPSTTLTIPMRAIEEWTFRTSQDNANQRFTPPLPDVSASTVSASVERVALVPYGSTQLRMTIFPIVGE